MKYLWLSLFLVYLVGAVSCYRLFFETALRDKELNRFPAPDYLVRVIARIVIFFFSAVWPLSFFHKPGNAWGHLRYAHLRIFGDKAYFDKLHEEFEQKQSEQRFAEQEARIKEREK